MREDPRPDGVSRRGREDRGQVRGQRGRQRGIETSSGVQISGAPDSIAAAWRTYSSGARAVGARPGTSGREGGAEQPRSAPASRAPRMLDRDQQQGGQSQPEDQPSGGERCSTLRHGREHGPRGSWRNFTQISADAGTIFSRFIDVLIVFSSPSATSTNLPPPSADPGPRRSRGRARFCSAPVE